MYALKWMIRVRCVYCIILSNFIEFRFDKVYNSDLCCIILVSYNHHYNLIIFEFLTLYHLALRMLYILNNLLLCKEATKV